MHRAAAQRFENEQMEWLNATHELRVDSRRGTFVARGRRLDLAEILA
jgi:hypothetical protein